MLSTVEDSHMLSQLFWKTYNKSYSLIIFFYSYSFLVPLYQAIFIMCFLLSREVFGLV